MPDAAYLRYTIVFDVLSILISTNIINIYLSYTSHEGIGFSKLFVLYIFRFYSKCELQSIYNNVILVSTTAITVKCFIHEYIILLYYIIDGYTTVLAIQYTYISTRYYLSLFYDITYVLYQGRPNGRSC